MTLACSSVAVARLTSKKVHAFGGDGASTAAQLRQTPYSKPAPVLGDLAPHPHSLLTDSAALSLRYHPFRLTQNPSGTMMSASANY